tara:strand:+ start:407 stop:1168 length:762 start_codon:yes stop_codon:yes gene_type:complete
MSKTTIPAGGITDSAVTTAKINADAVDATKIADDAISEEHLDATAITGHTALTSAPAGTDEFLISDGGVLKRLDASLIGGAGLVHLNTTSNSSAHGSVEVDGLFSSTYTNYLVFFQCTIASGNEHLAMRFRTSSGNHTSGDYEFHFRRLMGDSDSTNIRRNTNHTECQLTDGLGTDTQRVSYRGTLIIQSPNSSSERKGFIQQAVVTDNSGNPGYMFGGGQVKTSTAMVGINFLASSGNLTNSTLRVYGIVDS